MPTLQPPDIWQQSSRYQIMKDVLFKFLYRAKQEWVPGHTYEQVIKTLVAGEINSYRQMPKNFYQIQTKFRDEIRPRFGLMRAKEFIMKDAYSFDATDEAAQESYRKMYDAYARLFQRCGLKTLAVEADTGVMGGKFSHEFMVPAETGENEVFFCEGCGYAANVDKATSGIQNSKSEIQSPESALEKFATPGVLTIDALSQAPYNVPAERQIKTLVYLAESKPVLILLRGDDQLNEAKLAGALGTANFRPSEAEEIFSALGAHPGSLGALGVTKFQILADERLRDGSGMTTGANEDGFHLRNVSVRRDIQQAHWADLRVAQAGEPCRKCGKPLKAQRAIEVGHVFKLGTKYSEVFNALFLDDSGKQQPAIMGCYGIGVTRTLQAVIEQSQDQNGVIWPLSIA